MDTLHDAYLKGARRLCEETEQGSEDHAAASTLHMRLAENISEMVNGNSGDNKGERNDILSLLNRITERSFKISFRKYCGLDKQQEVLHGKDEDVGRDNSSLSQNITDILVLKSVKEENTEPYAQESDLEEQAYDFLITANAYVAALLPCVHNARKAFDNARLRPQECIDAYEPLCLFFHSCIPSHDPKLFEMRVRLDSLNDQILEVTKLFREFCLEAQKNGKHTSKTQRGLDMRLTTLQANAEVAQYVITSVKQEKIVPNKNISSGDIS